MFKISKRNIITIFTVVVLFAFILLVLNYFNQKEIEQVTAEYFKKGDERRGGLVIKNSLKKGNKNKYTLTKFDIKNPITSYILFVSDIPDTDLEDIQFETFYLERVGINEFKVNESMISRSTKYTFEEAVELAKKYDVYKNNPDPENIANYPKLNLTEEQKQQQLLTPEMIKQGQMEDKAVELCGGIVPPVGDPKMDQFFECYDAKLIELQNGN